MLGQMVNLQKVDPDIKMKVDFLKVLTISPIMASFELN